MERDPLDELMEVIEDEIRKLNEEYAYSVGGASANTVGLKIQPHIEHFGEYMKREGYAQACREMLGQINKLEQTMKKLASS